MITITGWSGNIVVFKQVLNNYIRIYQNMFQSCTFLGGKCVKNLKIVFDDWQLNYWKSNNQVISVSGIDLIENFKLNILFLKFPLLF